MSLEIHIPELAKKYLKPWADSLREVATSRFYHVYLALTFGFGALVYTLAAIYGAGFTFSSALYSGPLHGALVAFVVLFVLVRLFYITIVLHPPRPLTMFIQEVRHVWFMPRRVVWGMAIMLFVPLFFSFFTSAKNMIPVIQPFAWDPFLAEADRLLHGGRHPWEWLHPFLKFAAVTATISFFYKLWFFNKYIMVVWQAFSLKRPQLRKQFFITMLLSWIINGFVLALFFSSAGPCYFDYFYPDLPNPYEGLMSFLRQSHQRMEVMDLWAMDYLLQAYKARTTDLFSGISAFPSMHVSVALLNMLVAWRIHRGLGIVFAVYLGFIMLGSVHIGWHYAVDGYMSLVTTTFIWLIVGRFFAKDQLTAPHNLQDDKQS